MSAPVKYLKSRYYPVNYDTKTIYNDPQKREVDCSLVSRRYKGMGTIGIKGHRILSYQCYKDFTVVDKPCD